MTFACARALRVCAMLVLPASAFAQSRKTPTIFSPTEQLGTVNVRAAIVLADYTIKPLPLLKVVALRTDRADSVSGETNLDGRLGISLRVGTYTLRAKTAQPVAGRSYSWAVRVIVRPQRTESIQLTNSNADSVVAPTVVAAAPPTEQPAPAPKPAAQRPAQVVPPNKVVAADTARPPAPTPAPVPLPAAPPATAPQVAPQPSPFTPPARRVAASPKDRTNTSKLLLGLSFDASSIQSDDLTRSRESGPGVAAQLGWGFTKNFALLLDASGARISTLDGDFNLAHVDLGGRWHFVNRSAFVPFLDVGYAGRALTQQDALLSDGNGNTLTGDLSILGGGVSFGGGFEYFATPGLALGGAFKWTTGQFTQVKVANVTVDGLHIDATSARFNMGFTWFPMGR